MNTYAVSRPWFSCFRKPEETSPEPANKTMEEIFKEIVKTPPQDYVALHRDLEATRIQVIDSQTTEKALVSLDLLDDISIAAIARVGTASLEFIDGAFLTSEDHWNNFKDGVINAVDAVIDMIGINKLLAPSKGVLEPALKRNALLSLVTLLVSISGMLVAAAVPNAPLIVLAIAIGLVAITILHTHFKPASRNIAEGENLTQLKRQGKLPQVSGRSIEEQEVIATIRAGQNLMILGKSGSGKSELVKGVASTLQGIPELKHKMIIDFNTANLAAGNPSVFTTDHILDVICEQMGDHSKEYIFVFDEIHAAFIANDTSFPEKLKTKIGDKKSPIPLVIGVTTEDEYETNIKANLAFCRRFPVTINLKNTSHNNTFSILTNYLSAKHPAIIIKPEDLDFLIKETKKIDKGIVQPGASLFVLQQCIACTDPTYFTERAKKTARLLNTSNTLDSRIRLGLANVNEHKKADKAMKNYQISLRILRREEAKKIKLVAMQQAVLNIKKDLFKTAREAQQSNSAKKEELRKKATYISSCIPKLENHIRDEATKSKIAIGINQELIEKVIAKNKSDLEKSFAHKRGQNGEPALFSDHLFPTEREARRLLAIAP